MRVKKERAYLAIARLYSTPHFVFLAVMFLCGALVGSFTGVRAGQADAESVQQLVELVQQSAQVQSMWYLLCTTLLPVLAWHLLALVAGRIALHSFWLSVLLATRGFGLGFSAGALLQVLGWQGLCIAFASSGIGAILGVPCLLITATAAFVTASEQPQRTRYWYLLQRYRWAIVWAVLCSLAGALLRIPCLFLLG